MSFKQRLSEIVAIGVIIGLIFFAGRHFLRQAHDKNEEFYATVAERDTLHGLVAVVSGGMSAEKTDLPAIKASTRVAIGMSYLHQGEAEPVEVSPDISDNIISYRVTESGQVVAATLSPKGNMCAVTSQNDEMRGTCLSSAEQPEAFKDPLNSIMNHPELWVASQS